MASKKDVRLEDIANKVGVSIVSVSNAIYGRRGVSSSLREQIRAAAAELGYQPVHTAPAGIMRHYRIGILADEECIRKEVPFYTEAVRASSSEILRCGGTPVLSTVSVRAGQEPDLSFLSDTSADGLLLIGNFRSDFLRQVEKKSSLPLAGLGCFAPDMQLDYVLPDTFHGMYTVVQQLIYQGHRKIGFAGSLRGCAFGLDQYMGCLRALEMNALPEEKAFFIDTGDEYSENEISFRLLPEKMPTAFACCSDRIAASLIKELNRRGYAVPGDISVSGFFHADKGRPSETEISSFSYNPHEAAGESVRILTGRIFDRKEPQGVCILQGTLTKGTTAGRLKNE